MKENEIDHHKVKCNKLVAKLHRPNGVYAGNVSGYPMKEASLDVENYKISITENFFREVIISGDTSKADLFFEKLNELLMLNQLAECYFPIVKSVEIYMNDELVGSMDTETYSKLYVYFPTNSEYIRSELSLISIFDLLPKLSSTGYSSYRQIRKDLIIQLNILYMALSDNYLFPEVRIAFLIELFEALTEYENLEDSNSPLKLHISSFILFFGREIFKTELENKLNFTPRLVSTRVNVMHIKLSKEVRKNKLTKEQFIVYNFKLQLLYRIYLLQKLGINVDLTNALDYSENPFDTTLNFDLKRSFKEATHDEQPL